MKLEVGMYAYSKSCRDYGIGKIVDITESGLGFKGDLVDIQYRHSKHAIENTDVIAGFDTMDLIEVGDIIRYRIGKVPLETKGYLTGVTDITDKEMIENIKENKNYHVLQILTKEEFEKRAYKVGE